jgi:hypothetical protein
MNPITLPFFYDYVFPNLILPNGSPPEFGIINYINTMYSNKFRNETLFEFPHEAFKATPMSIIFGNHLGVMPSSLRMGGSYLGRPCFSHIVNIQENSVYFGKKQTDRYIYPMKITLHFDRFTGFDRIGDKQNGEFFWKHISDEVLKDVRARKAFIFLDWANENFIEKREFEELHLALKRSGILKEQIILSINSFNAQEIYESWFSPEERCIEVRNLPFLLANISWFFAVNTHTRISDQEFQISKNVLREHHFLFPNRRARPHRLAMIMKMASDGILNQGDWSLLNDTTLDHGFHEALQIFSINKDNVKIQFPHNLKDEPGKSFSSDSGWDPRTTYKPYLDSYFYIASETFVQGEYKSLTEKIFKPIANFQPFLFIAFPGALAELKKLGFKTFHPYIDESYDLENDYKKRMLLIYNEVQRLCNMPKEELHNWYWSMEDILVHNRNHLFEIYKSETHSVKFVEHLASKLK